MFDLFFYELIKLYKENYEDIKKGNQNILSRRMFDGKKKYYDMKHSQDLIIYIQMCHSLICDYMNDYYYYFS